MKAIHSRSISLLILSTLVAVAMPTRAGFISDGAGRLYDYDVATLTSTFIGSTGIAFWDIARDPTTDILYGITSGGMLMSINTSTAATTLIGGNADARSSSGLTFDSAGTLFASGGSMLLTIDLITGLSTQIGRNGVGAISAGDIAFGPDGSLFMSDQTRRLVSLDPTTGAGTIIGDFGSASRILGMDFDGTTLIGFTERGITLAIDTATGVGIPIATNGIGVWGADGGGGVQRVIPIPEPPAIALFGLCLTALGVFRREKV